MGNKKKKFWAGCSLFLRSGLLCLGLLCGGFLGCLLLGGLLLACWLGFALFHGCFLDEPVFAEVVEEAFLAFDLLGANLCGLAGLVAGHRVLPDESIFADAIYITRFAGYLFFSNNCAF